MVSITDLAANELKHFLLQNKITGNNVRLYISGLG
jgi:Fe-S cluster assembly iron-binding protein IscA